MEAGLAMIDSVLLFSNEMEPLGELSKHAGTLDQCVMSLEINGEHSLSIDTTVQLDVGTRALTMDPSGRWREWVVDEPEQEHSSTDYGTCSYHLVWSLQYDLQQTNIGRIDQPGMSGDDGCGAFEALRCALDGSVWDVGTVEPKTKTAVVMNYNSAWDRLNQVVKYWGGEIDDKIEVYEPVGVTGREVNLVDHVGDKEPWRRLEWRHDLTSISRTPDPGPYFCRVMPLGNGESIIADDGETSISEPLTLEHLIGKKYIADTEAEKVFRMRMRYGFDHWHYPITAVSYSTDDENELLTLAYEDLHNHTRPEVSYSGTVSQLVEAGMELGDGVNLGDEVQIVDYGFNKDHPLTTCERVVKIEWDLINQEDKKVTIGKFRQTLEKTMAGMASAVGVEKVVANTAMDIPSIQIPEYPAMVIETPSGDYTISPSNYEPLDLSQYTSDYDQRLSDLETLMSGLTGVEYDPDTDTFYDRDGDVIQANPVTEAADPTSFVGNTPINNAVSPFSSSLSFGGDGWVHQIDGVTQSGGTVNFITAGGNGGEGSNEEPDNNSKTARKNEQAEHVAALGVSKQTSKNSSSSSKKQKSRTNFAVTAANIAGSMGIYVGDPTGQGDRPTYNELFGKSNDDNSGLGDDDEE